MRPLIMSARVRVGAVKRGGVGQPFDVTTAVEQGGVAAAISFAGAWRVFPRTGVALAAGISGGFDALTPHAALYRVPVMHPSRTRSVARAARDAIQHGGARLGAESLHRVEPARSTGAAGPSAAAPLARCALCTGGSRISASRSWVAAEGRADAAQVLLAVRVHQGVHQPSAEPHPGSRMGPAPPHKTGERRRQERGTRPGDEAREGYDRRYRRPGDPC